MPHLLIVIASTRPGRVGLPLGEWFAGRAEDHGGFTVEVADLAELGLPLFDEPNHPRLRRYEHPHTLEWSAIVDRADAVVFVTPEYNHAYPAGTRAVTALKPVVSAVRMFPVPEAVNVPFVAEVVRDGEVHANDVMLAAADTLLDELLAAEAALSPRRAAVPAAS